MRHIRTVTMFLLLLCRPGVGRADAESSRAAGSTLAVIVAAAPDDARLQLESGIFQGPLVVRGRRLVIQGAGPGRTILQPGGDEAAFIRVEDGGQLELRDLTLDLGGLPGLDAGIMVSGGAAGFAGPRTDSWNLVLSNGCLVGGNRPGSVGVLVDATAGPLNVLVERMIIEGWDRAIRTLGAGASVTAMSNRLAPNLTAGFDNTDSGSPQEARYVWWGSPSGPAGVGPGTGTAVLGSGVSFYPWLATDTDLDPLCGFNPPVDDLITPGPADTCLSTRHPCVTVPILISRNDIAQVRGFSVQIALSPELMLCPGPGAIAEGDYLTLANPLTDFHVLEDGGGLYTVDDAILGLPCGAGIPGGTLFLVRVAPTVTSGTGTISLAGAMLRDCENRMLLTNLGPPVTIPIDMIPPLPATGLTATQLKSGNDSDGTTKILLTWTPSPDAAGHAVYRAPYGNYPEYDDPPGGGATPAVPGYPPPLPWQLTPVTASGQFDEPANRDLWHYVVFGLDACGNGSVASNRTAGRLNYHLGDFHNAVADCAGDNRVNTADLSFLGANYAIALAPMDPLACLDIGPTLDFSVDTRPITDNVIDFEDLMILALNYASVSKPVGPGDRPTPVSGDDRLAIEGPALLGAGQSAVYSLRMAGSGRIQGLSVAFAIAPEQLEIVSVEPGEWLARLDRAAVVMKGRGGSIDVALLGGGPGLSGEGELARVTLRAARDRTPAPAIAGATARDGNNQPVGLTAGPTAPPPEAPVATRINWVAAAPRGGIDISFSLARAGSVELTAFDVLGRPVRRLVREERPAGSYRLTWDGRDDAGRPGAVGLYLFRLTADGTAQTRRALLLK